MNVEDKGTLFKLIAKLSLDKIEHHDNIVREVRFTYNEFNFKFLIYKNSYARFSLVDGTSYMELIDWYSTPSLSWVSPEIAKEANLIIKVEDKNGQYTYMFPKATNIILKKY